jgi:hypothetical protein
MTQLFKRLEERRRWLGEQLMVVQGLYNSRYTEMMDALMTNDYEEYKRCLARSDDMMKELIELRDAIVKVGPQHSEEMSKAFEAMIRKGFWK